MESTDFIWYTGKFIPWKKATTHVLTHGLNYGTGIFEGIRCYPINETSNNGSTGSAALFRLDDHLKRFLHSAKALCMKIPFSHAQLKNAVIKTVNKNKVFDVYIRPLAFFGYKKLGPNPADSPVEVIIACIPLKDYLKRNFIRVKTASLRRIPPISCLPHTKISGMYFNSALASLEAAAAGCEEAIVLDYRGYVAEGAAENFFIVKNGSLFTPPADTILPGITRHTLQILAKDLSIPYREKRIALAELKKADEAFLTGTAVEIHSIGAVDGVRLSHKNPITKKLQEYYHAVVHGKVPKYRKWLTKI